MNIVTAKVHNVEYEFIFQCDEYDELVVRHSGSHDNFREAFSFFRVILDDGVKYHEELFAVMDKLAKDNPLHT